jgi:hypothetical protein
MEEVDIYSNMLYVMDKKAKLGKLAHEYAEIDRNRAEVCCLIGKLANTVSVTIADDWATTTRPERTIQRPSCTSSDH